MEETKITITINGETKEVPPGLFINDLLDFLKVRKETAIVEHNLNVLKSKQLEETIVKEGDRLEIVRFVGGG